MSECLRTYGPQIIRGSQLQVAKLAQMCPVVPNGGLRRPALRGKTQMEHLGAPWSTKCPFKTNSPSFYVRLKKRRVKAPDPDPDSTRNLEAPKEPLGA